MNGVLILALTVAVIYTALACAATHRTTPHN